MGSPHPCKFRGVADVVGISCRFPESASAGEFWANLVSGHSLVTETDTRWQVGKHGVPRSKGVAPGYQFFDAPFFAVHGKQAQVMEPSLRKLLEVSYEAWMDSGIDVNLLRDSWRVGVYVGSESSEVQGAWLANAANITGYEQTGCASCMLSNRLSFWYSFRGPSKTIDTACSSSLVALHDAVADVEAGRIDFAMVGGASALLSPNHSAAYLKLHMLSEDGTCKSFDASANGYVRADGIAVVIIKRRGYMGVPRWCSLPIYCHILAGGVNNDGHTKEGITFPNGFAQQHLARSVCQAAGISPLDVAYVEAHGTGTAAGDGVELKTVEEVYVKHGKGRSREAPLLIGSVKSNMGHSEACSGLAGLIKLCLAFEHGMLPGNLHFNTPNPSSCGLTDGTIQVVTSSRKWAVGPAALSSFGFGGTNAHFIVAPAPNNRYLRNSQSQLSSFYPDSPTTVVQEPDGYYSAGLQSTSSSDSLCSLLLQEEYKEIIPLSSRTKEGVEKLAHEVKHHGSTRLVLPLRRFANALGRNLCRNPFRGTLIDGNLLVSQGPSTPPPVWFVFSGNGSQWPRMALELIKHCPTFRESIQDCAAVVAPYGVDLMAEFQSEKGWKNPALSALGLAATQIGLVDTLVSDYGVVPSGVLGHSAGEIACGYGDGGFTREQTMLVAYHRGRMGALVSGGLMAATGLSAEAAEARLKEAGLVDICVVACDNSPVGTTLSGPEDELRAFCHALKDDGVFVRELETGGVAFHCPLLEPLLPELRAALEEVLPQPKPRSATWISSTFPLDSKDPEANLCSGNYQVAGFRNRVLFKDACMAVPDGVVMLEIGPHSILRALIRQCRPELPYVATMQKGTNAMMTLRAAVGELWRLGANVKWLADAPLNGSPSAGELPRPVREALVSWDHQVEYPTLPTDRGEAEETGRTGLFRRKFSLEEQAWLTAQRTSGGAFLPAAAQLLAVWEAAAAKKNVALDEFTPIFEEVAFRRPVPVLQGVQTIVLAVSLDLSDRFQVIFEDELVAEGIIRKAPSSTTRPSLAREAFEEIPSRSIGAGSLYLDFARAGLQVGADARHVVCLEAEGKVALLRTELCWLGLLNGALQAASHGLLNFPLQHCIPTYILSLAITGPTSMIPDVMRLDMEPLAGAAQCEALSLSGLSLGPPQLQSPSNWATTLHRYEWVPYGERVFVDDTRLQYARLVADLIKNRLAPHLAEVELAGGLPPHLQRVQSLLGDVKNMRNVSTTAAEALLGGSNHVLARICSDILHSTRIKETLQAPLEAINGHPEARRLYGQDFWGKGVSTIHLGVFLDIVAENAPPGLGLRICEVGARFGDFTSEVIVHLEKNPYCEFTTYVATDFDTEYRDALLSTTTSSKVVFKVWDVSTPMPTEIGGPFDLITSSHGLSRSSDISKTLSNLHAALADGGFLLFYEATNLLPAILWGLDESAWATCDLRDYARWLSVDSWKQRLRSSGFTCVTLLRTVGDEGALFLFRKVSSKACLTPALVPAPPLGASNHFMDTWIKTFNTYLTGKGDNSENAVWVHGTRADAAGVVGLVRCARHESGGSRLRCVLDASATPPSECSTIPGVADEAMSGSEMVAAAAHLDLLVNVFVDGVPGSYRAIPTSVEDVKCAAAAAARSTSPRRCHLKVSTSGRPYWVEKADNSRAPGSIPCKVTCGALLAMVKHAGPTLGFSFSGRDATGKAVVGLAAGPLASHADVLPYFQWAAPTMWPMDEAATVTLPYAAAYAVLGLAHLRCGDAILVQGADSPLGLACIRIAMCHGLQVFATVEDPAAAAHVLESFAGLPQENLVLEAKPQTFILSRTQGQGAQLVYRTSARGPSPTELARCVASRGHYVDLSGDNQNTLTLPSGRQIQVNISDAEELVFSLGDSLPVEESEAWKLHALLKDGLASGEVLPLPHLSITWRQIGEGVSALSEGRTFMTVVAMDNEAGERPIQPVPEFVCDEGGVYVITGGLGGFGLALAAWLVQRGASRLLLSSKRGLRTGGQARALAALARQGAQVKVSKLDVANVDEAKFLLDEAAQMGPVSAIFHLAMVLNDRWLSNQTGEGWNDVVEPKALGAVNLDIFSRDHPTLKHFVMFSSCVTMLGNQGQTNYAYANSTCEMIAEARRAAGLPGLCVGWGVVDHVGVVAESLHGKTSHNSGRIFDVSTAQPIDDCLRVLGALLIGGPTVGAIHGSYAGLLHPEVMQTASSSQQQMELLPAVLEIVGVPVSSVKDTDTLASLGMDSLQLSEVRNVMQKQLGRPIPVEHVGCFTISQLRSMCL